MKNRANPIEDAFWLTAFFAGTAAFYEGLVTRRYRLTTSKWPLGSKLRFVVVSDFHSMESPRRRQEILTTVEKNQPDFILLPGDIVDDRSAPAAARRFLRELPRIAPTFYAPGNHEYRTHRMPQLLARVERCGVTVLTDRFVRLDTAAGKLIIAGCEDPEKTLDMPRYDQAASMQRAFREIAAAPAYTVLLAHRPDRYRFFAPLGFDLAVSGHAHGGQCRIPYLLNGLVAPNQGFFPKYAGGCYPVGRTKLVVSRGVVAYPWVPRIFNPPEVVTIDVEGAFSE